VAQTAPQLNQLRHCSISQDFKPIAKKMESAGLITFKPHYLLWVCQYGAESDECKTQCIRQGAYCCPDPDDNIHEGYSGAEVPLVSCSASLQQQQDGIDTVYMKQRLVLCVPAEVNNSGILY
jgi:hypothetical protein